MCGKTQNDEIESLVEEDDGIDYASD